MKNFFRYVLPILVIIAVFAFLILRDSSPAQVVGEAVVSENGTEELLDFMNSLADGQYANAAQYVQENCETNEPYCLKSDLSNAEIIDYLTEMCSTSICQKVELDKAGDANNANVYTHDLSFLDDNGERERICLDKECRIQKIVYGFRVVKVDGKWFVIDTPPTRVK